MSSQATSILPELFDVALVQHIRDVVGGRVREFVPAAQLTTFGVGGPVRAVVTVESLTELVAVQKILFEHAQPVRILGNGSNLLISDAGLDSWTVRLGAAFRNVSKVGDRFEVGGAASLMSLARKLSDEGFSGLEFAAGIPASIGGATFMNAGAHGSEICERICHVRGVLPDGSQRTWRREELPWRYRWSGLPAGVTVTSIELELVEGDKATIARACSAHLSERRARQPLSLPSAGSVFKNPSPTEPAGRVLEGAGLKGHRIGGAVVSELHANWIVNPEKQATAADVAQLIDYCRSRVREHSGIELEPEVKLWF